MNGQQQRQALYAVVIGLPDCITRVIDAQCAFLGTVPDSVALWFPLGKEGMTCGDISDSYTFYFFNKRANMAMCQHL